MVSTLLEAGADIEARDDVSCWLLHNFVYIRIMAVMRNKRVKCVANHIGKGSYMKQYSFLYYTIIDLILYFGINSSLACSSYIMIKHIYIAQKLNSAVVNYGSPYLSSSSLFYTAELVIKQ